jgi:hypothetical protein
MAVAQVNIFVSNILASFLPQGALPVSLLDAAGSSRSARGRDGMAGVPRSPARRAGETDRLWDFLPRAAALLHHGPKLAGPDALRGDRSPALFARALRRGRRRRPPGAPRPGVWAMVGVRVVTATFYALQETRMPVRVGVGAMVVNLVLSVALMGPLAHAGLALANACASMANFAALFLLLRRRLGRVDAGRILRSLLRTSVAAALMGLAGWALLRGPLWETGGHTALKAGLFAAAAALCLGIYAGASRLLGSEELSAALALMRRRPVNR